MLLWGLTHSRASAQTCWAKERRNERNEGFKDIFFFLLEEPTGHSRSEVCRRRRVFLAGTTLLYFSCFLSHQD